MIRVLIPALLLVPALGAAGCSGASAPPSPTSAVPAALSAPEAAFVEQARRIAPALVGSDERVATRGANTCSLLTDGRPQSQVVDTAIKRFSSGSYSVTRDEAEQLVEAARGTVCAES
ncbi:hypothetical protein Ae168Ps1_6312 [Pseudonocardia sp. Ae168_Ps1]|uniref:DUF732 domain-containing protein n=1 Tax=unclassified Pseudonocardia TaxID=2619320 RepID=UPI00094AC4CE|nr:hypothetical protein Ae168Ps1_6312 [Pseudonocardia sp. Ae168_Ps1]OLL88970.1 hypothetical protein Ae356Ps1_6374c [Pseudonocardia sp. Ae356_Ps1]